MDVGYCFSDPPLPSPLGKDSYAWHSKWSHKEATPVIYVRNQNVIVRCVKDWRLIIMPFFLDFVAVTRKLGFLEVEGYDIFGKNELFAPRIKWEALKTIVEGIKNTASEYERAYNDIKESIESKSNFQKVDDDDYI